MDFRSNQAAPDQTAAMLAAARKLRRYYRHKIHNLAYINLGHSNGGIIRNLSEAGVAIQAVTPMQENQEVHLRFELLNPRTRVEATGRIAWTEPSGQAGVEFLAVPLRARRQLKEWLFMQLLGAAAQAASTESIFAHGRPGELPAELVFSSSGRTTIQLKHKVDLAVESGEEEEPLLDLAWCPVPVSPRTLARLIDTLMVFAAVLLFCVVASAMTHVFPSWPIALALSGAVAGAFGALYWFLFVLWLGLTPGGHLARLAGSYPGSDVEQERDETPRFR